MLSVVNLEVGRRRSDGNFASFLVADDHEIVRLGLVSIITSQSPDGKCVPREAEEERWGVACGQSEGVEA